MASGVDAGAPDGVIAVAGLVVVLLEAGLAAVALAGAAVDGSVAGCIAGVVAAAPVLLEAGGVVELVSGESEV